MRPTGSDGLPMHTSPTVNLSPIHGRAFACPSSASVEHYRDPFCSSQWSRVFKYLNSHIHRSIASCVQQSIVRSFTPTITNSNFKRTLLVARHGKTSRMPYPSILPSLLPSRRRQRPISDVASIPTMMILQDYAHNNDESFEIDFFMAKPQRFRNKSCGSTSAYGDDDGDLMTVFSNATTVKAGSPAIQRKVRLLAASSTKIRTDGLDDLTGQNLSTRPFWKFKRNGKAAAANDSRSVVSTPNMRTRLRFLVVPRLRRIGAVSSKAAMITERDAEYPQNDFRKVEKRATKPIPFQLARYIVSQQAMQNHDQQYRDTLFITDSDSSLGSIEVCSCEVWTTSNIQKSWLRFP